MSFQYPFEGAEWIWINHLGGINEYVDFFDTLDYTGGDVSFSVCADTSYTFYVNGNLASCLPVAGYEDMLFYDSLEISSYLQHGGNDIRITVYTQGINNSVARANLPGLIYAAHGNNAVLCASSSKTRCRLNPTYVSGEMECISGQLGFSFRYDQTIAACAFSQTVVINKREPLLRPIKRLRLESTAPSTLLSYGSFVEQNAHKDTGRRMQYAGLYGNEDRRRDRFPNSTGSRFVKTKGADGIWLVVDMGREECGLLELEADFPCDCEVLIGWGQHMEDLRTRTALGGRNFAASCKFTAGHQIFIQPFKRLGARYLQLHIYAPEVTIYKASLIPTVYPLSSENYFSCSDHMHNKIFEVSRRTLELCMHEHYEDCQWREQALYTMDSRNQMLCGYYCFGEIVFPALSLRLIAHSLRDDGMLELCSPAKVDITIPSFTAIFLRQLYEFYLYAKDKETTLELLPTAKACADAFLARIDKSGLIPAPKEYRYWNFYEWQEGLDGYPLGDVSDDALTYDAPLMAFVILGLQSLGQLCSLLGYDNDSLYYINAASSLSDAADAAFYDPSDGLYFSFRRIHDGTYYHKCELTQSLFVYADIVPECKRSKVLEALASEKLIPVTLSYSIFKYEALLTDAARYGRYVFNSVAKIWGRMLYSGATAFWETSDGADAFGFAGSLCHGWSAIPAYLYYRYALGIDLADGCRNPIDSGLYECKGKVLCGDYEIEI